MYVDLVRFESKLQTALETHDVLERRMALEEVLIFARTASIDVRTLLGDTVAAARAHGLSWARVGGALGVSAQAAQQMYGTKKPEPSQGPGLFD